MSVLAIISLQLPTVNDHMSTKTTVFGGERERYRLLNQVWHRGEQCKRLLYPRGQVFCGSEFYVLGIINALTERTDNLSMTFFLAG